MEIHQILVKGIYFKCIVQNTKTFGNFLNNIYLDLITWFKRV